MRIFFEDYQYSPDLLEEYFKGMREACDDKFKTRFVGYIYNKDKYDGPIFILPKALLLKRGGKLTFLGIKNAVPDHVKAVMAKEIANMRNNRFISRRQK